MLFSGSNCCYQHVVKLHVYVVVHRVHFPGEPSLRAGSQHCNPFSSEVRLRAFHCFERTHLGLRPAPTILLAMFRNSHHQRYFISIRDLSEDLDASRENASPLKSNRSSTTKFVHLPGLVPTAHNRGSAQEASSSVFLISDLQISVSSEDACKTDVTMSLGLFEFAVIPIVLRNAAQILR